MITTRTQATAYRPDTAARAFARVLSGDNPRLALGDFLDDWRRTPARRRAALVTEPIGDPGQDQERLRWAAFFAAAVDQLCATSGITPPPWISRSEYRLQEPWFLVAGWPLRAWQLVTTPVPFRMRNIFGGDNLLSRV